MENSYIKKVNELYRSWEVSRWTKMKKIDNTIKTMKEAKSITKPKEIKNATDPPKTVRI